MKKVLYRILAFGLDTILVSIIVTLLAYMPFITPKQNEISKKTKEALELRTEYQQFLNDVNAYFEDNIISEEEYNKIPEMYKEYFDTQINSEIEKEKQEEIKNKISEVSVDNYNDLSYSISKMSIRQNYVSVIISILYFGILQYILNGQTLFKKLFRLRVIDNKNTKNKIPLWKYIIRSILICEIIFIVLDIILISTVSKDSYISISSTTYMVKMAYEMLFLLFIAVRVDGRSIHDLLLNTRVAFYDKKGHEVKDVLYQDNFDEEVKEEKETKTKKTTKKNIKKVNKKKEIVEAEKVK